MDEPQLIWRFGRWIARRSSGAARLAWSSGELVLRIFEGRVVSVEGIDTAEVGRRLECEPLGLTDLLEEARALASERNIPETQAVGTAKEIIQQSVRAWLMDRDRELELVDGEPDEVEGAAISITHAIVEMVLNDLDQEVCAAILPDLKVLLRRTGNFLELYAPLRLSEDADLIVAKITGQRTAEEVATRSPHGSSDVLRLLAALVATGMLEPVPVVTAAEEVDLLPTTLAEPEVVPRKIPAPWILVGAVALALVLVAAGMLLLRAEKSPPAPEDGSWAVVVDIGCEPQDLQRVLKKANQHPKTLHAVKADMGEEAPCWRLVWGDFGSQEEAEEAIPQVPAAVKREGFEPHPIELAGPLEGAAEEPSD